MTVWFKVNTLEREKRGKQNTFNLNFALTNGISQIFQEVSRRVRRVQKSPEESRRVQKSPEESRRVQKRSL
jgi:hypothetical protein